jgi:hypothetical protein
LIGAGVLAVGLALQHHLARGRGLIGFPIPQAGLGPQLFRRLAQQAVALNGHRRLAQIELKTVATDLGFAVAALEGCSATGDPALERKPGGAGLHPGLAAGILEPYRGLQVQGLRQAVAAEGRGRDALHSTIGQAPLAPHRALGRNCTAGRLPVDWACRQPDWLCPPLLQQW